MTSRGSLSTKLFRAFVEVPAVVVLFLMMMHVTANALSRKFFDHPLPHTLEVVQYWYMPILALLGFVAAQARGQHIATDLVFARLPQAVRPAVLCVMFGIGAVLAAGFAWFGWSEAVHAHSIDQTAGISPLPSWPVYFLVPITFGVLAIQWAVQAVRALTGHDPDLDVTHTEDELALDELPAQEVAR